MEKNRRNFMKGMLTGGTLLAFGIPGITQAVSICQPSSGKTGNCQLLLGNTPAGGAFSRGAHAACAVYADFHQGIIPVVRLTNELLLNPRGVTEFLERSSGTRWIAVMDDASAAIFMGLVREADGHLLAFGSHASSGDGVTLALRHVWNTASPVFSAGELLVSGLMQSRHNFSIVENFLENPVGEDGMTGLPIAGFSSYRLAEQQAVHLHCAGVTPAEACKSVGWKATEKWEPVFRQDDGLQAAKDQAGSDAALEFPRSDNWVETTGYAVVAMALGMGGHHYDICSSRAFVHGLGQRDLDSQVLSGKHFVTLVIDV